MCFISRLIPIVCEEEKDLSEQRDKSQSERDRDAQLRVAGRCRNTPSLVPTGKGETKTELVSESFRRRWPGQASSVSSGLWKEGWVDSLSSCTDMLHKGWHVTWNPTIALSLSAISTLETAPGEIATCCSPLCCDIVVAHFFSLYINSHCFYLPSLCAFSWLVSAYSWILLIVISLCPSTSGTVCHCVLFASDWNHPRG